MRTILSLALALVISGGVTMLSGCDKGKTTAKDEHKTETTGPGGAKTTTKTETEKTETPPSEKK